MTDKKPEIFWIDNKIYIYQEDGTCVELKEDNPAFKVYSTFRPENCDESEEN